MSALDRRLRAIEAKPRNRAATREDPQWLEKELSAADMTHDEMLAKFGSVSAWVYSRMMAIKPDPKDMATDGLTPTERYMLMLHPGGAK